MINYNGKKYYNPKQAVANFPVAESTLYYWVSNGEIELLDIDEFCENNPLDKDDLIAKYYIPEDILVEKSERTE
jgi:hypothetical protein